MPLAPFRRQIRPLPLDCRSHPGSRSMHPHGRKHSTLCRLCTLDVCCNHIYRHRFSHRPGNLLFGQMELERDSWSRQIGKPPTIVTSLVPVQTHRGARKVELKTGRQNHDEPCNMTGYSIIMKNRYEKRDMARINRLYYIRTIVQKGETRPTVQLVANHSQQYRRR